MREKREREIPSLPSSVGFVIQLCLPPLQLLPLMDSLSGPVKLLQVPPVPHIFARTVPSVGRSFASGKSQVKSHHYFKA